jgi:hypothetical protein
MAQAVDRLPNKNKALSPNPSTVKKKKIALHLTYFDSGI